MSWILNRVETKKKKVLNTFTITNKLVEVLNKKNYNRMRDQCTLLFMHDNECWVPFDPIICCMNPIWILHFLALSKQSHTNFLYFNPPSLLANRWSKFIIINLTQHLISILYNTLKTWISLAWGHFKFYGSSYSKIELKIIDRKWVQDK